MISLVSTHALVHCNEFATKQKKKTKQQKLGVNFFFKN